MDNIKYPEIKIDSETNVNRLQKGDYVIQSTDKGVTAARVVKIVHSAKYIAIDFDQFSNTEADTYNQAAKKTYLPDTIFTNCKIVSKKEFLETLTLVNLLGRR